MATASLLELYEVERKSVHNLLETATLRNREDDHTMRIKLIPSEEGSGAFLRRGTSLKRIALAAGDQQLGLSLPQYHANSIRQLLARGLISTLELEGADFLETRSEIQSLCHAVGSAAIHGAFRRDISREIERLRYRLKGSPTVPVPDNTGVTVLRSILAPFKDGTHSRLVAAARMLRSLPPVEKREIHALVRSDSSGSVLKSLRDVLAHSADRADVPEYLALVVLELVSCVQIQTMHSFAVRSGVSDETIRSLYQDPETRAKIRIRMEAAGETNAITWSFSNSGGPGSRTTRMSIVMIGSGSPMQATSAGVRHQKGVNVEGKSLKDFYEELGAGGGVGLDLGLYYLSYLEKLCRTADIRFETQARDLSSGGKTMVGVRLYV